MAYFGVNIGADDVRRQQEELKSRTKNTTYNSNNYLDDKIAEGQSEKSMTIRLLPFTSEGGSPFKKVYMHFVKVPKDVSPNGWKKFVCKERNGLGDKCPFCETSRQAYKEADAVEPSDEQKKKMLYEVGHSYRASEFWVVRCIERGKESEGVKFWMFSHNRKGEGIYDKIINIFNERSKKGKNIFDINEGKDLNIKVTRNSLGKRAFQITDDDEYTPLTTNYELGMSWINDAKQWSDLWKPKSDEYMQIIINGGVPYWNKEEGGYIDKRVLDKKAEDEARADVEQAFNIDLSGEEIDLSQVSLKNQAPTLTVTKPQQASSLQESFGDDVPF